MRTLLSLALISLCFSLSAQETITYPYNPDGDADGLVAVPDLQDLLSVYGNPFSPAEITFGDYSLSDILTELSHLIAANSVRTRDFTFFFDATSQNDTIWLQDLVGEDVFRVTTEVIEVIWFSIENQDVVLSLKSNHLPKTYNYGDIEIRGLFNGESVFQRTPRNSSSHFTKTIGKLCNSGLNPYFVISPYSWSGIGGEGEITVRLSYQHYEEQ
jgi:hypothetical protein